MNIESLPDRPVILEQPAIWSRAFIWLIVGMTASGVIWAALAPIDQSIPATGQLKPKGGQEDVKAPIGGVVVEIHVEDGEYVEAGDKLITLDSTVSEADVRSLEEFRDALKLETDAYKARVGLGSLSGGSGEFANNQRQLLEAARTEAQSREASGRSQIQQLEEQLIQTRGQLAAARDRLSSAQNRLGIVQSGSSNDSQQLILAQQRLQTAQRRLQDANERLAMAPQRQQTAMERLDNEREIEDRIKPLVEAGAISELQLQRQEQERLARQQEVLSTQNELSRAQSEVASSEAEVLSAESAITTIQDNVVRRQTEVASIQDEIMARRGEIDRLIAEEQRLLAAKAQAQSQLQNTLAASALDNHRQIAENQKQLTRLDSQLTRAEQELDYRILRAPVSGFIFDLQPTSPGFVVRDTEPMLQIIPNSNLIASVHVTNKDIGFIHEGMEVELQVDTFPATEFGTIPGTLVSIGKDALPPNPQENRPMYTFPVTIELEQQAFDIGGREIPLQAGMSVNAKIKVRERTVLSIFTDQFLRKTRGLETVR